MKLKSVWVMIMCLCLSSVALASEEKPRLITVTGEAEVNVIPDEVVFRLGVETKDRDLEVAKETNDDRIKKIIHMLKRQGIDETDIQTDYLNVSPRYRDYKDKTIEYYVVSNQMTVLLKDMDKFEKVLTAVLKSGANRVQGIEFQSSQIKSYDQQAHISAIKNAKEKAVALATQLDQKVGRPYQISEQGTQPKSFRSMMLGDAREGAAVDGNTISAGQIKVTAHITVSFELE